MNVLQAGCQFAAAAVQFPQLEVVDLARPPRAPRQVAFLQEGAAVLRQVGNPSRFLLYLMNQL